MTKYWNATKIENIELEIGIIYLKRLCFVSYIVFVSFLLSKMGWNDLATGSLGANLKMLPALHCTVGLAQRSICWWHGPGLPNWIITDTRIVVARIFFMKLSYFSISILLWMKYINLYGMRQKIKECGVLSRNQTNNRFPDGLVIQRSPKI